MLPRFLNLAIAATLALIIDFTLYASPPVKMSDEQLRSAIAGVWFGEELPQLMRHIAERMQYFPNGTFVGDYRLSTPSSEHYIRNLFPTLNELKVILFAGVKITMHDFTVPGEMATAVNATAQELAKHMQPVQRESLKIVVQKWMEDGAKADLKRWMQAIEITASRAGLLLCADLEIARKIIAAEPQLPGDLPPAEKTKELLVFSVSEQYFGLRIVVQRFVEDGARADLKKWMQTVEATACRAGLLLCADLEIAKKIVSAEPQLPGDVTPAEKMKELLVFSVSEQYFALRKALGIAVG